MIELIPAAPYLGAGGLVLALALYAYVLRKPVGLEKPAAIARLIEQGSMAFLRRQYLTLLPVVGVVAAALAGTVGSKIAGAFVFGGACSIFAGYLGMKAATKANVRTTEAARAQGGMIALKVAFAGGAVMGLAVASLGRRGRGLRAI